MFWLTLVVGIGAVGARVGPWLRQLSDGQPLIQGQLAARHEYALYFTEFMPGWYVHHWVIVMVTVPFIA